MDLNSSDIIPIIITGISIFYVYKYYQLKKKTKSLGNLRGASMPSAEHVCECDRTAEMFKGMLETIAERGEKIHRLEEQLKYYRKQEHQLRYYRTLWEKSTANPTSSDQIPGCPSDSDSIASGCSDQE